METKAAWKLTLPLNREGTETATFDLKDMDDYDLFMAAQKLMEQDRLKDVVFMLLNSLRVGGDEVSRINGNFFAIQTGIKMFTELLKPVPGELKKISTTTQSA